MKSKTFVSLSWADYPLLRRRAHLGPQVTGGRRGAGCVMIDWERVKELRGEIGDDDFAEVAAMFLDEADQAVSRLVPGLTAKAMEDDLHFLKGAALNLGFQDLSALCQDSERRAAAGDTTVNLDAVRATYFTSKAAFQGGMAQAFAA